MKMLVLAGGSGFLGGKFKVFAEERGYTCVTLTRMPIHEADVQWDGKTPGDWCGVLDGAEAVVNFTGRSIDCVHNAKNRRDILQSRVDSVHALTKAIENCDAPPKVFVQTGALAYFGDTVTECDEDAPPGDDFTAEVCKAWEQAFDEATLPTTRKCLLRIGIVLGSGGGALGPLRKLTSMFLGGTTGPGTQYVSWLHETDMNRLLLACIENETMRGTYNATAPNPATNREFMRGLRKALGRPWSPPAPSLAVKLGALFVMRTDPSLALTGRRCISRRLAEEGFEFEHTDLDAALHDVLTRWGK